MRNTGISFQSNQEDMKEGQKRRRKPIQFWKPGKKKKKESLSGVKSSLSGYVKPQFWKSALAAEKVKSGGVKSALELAHLGSYSFFADTRPQGPYLSSGGEMPVFIVRLT